MRQVTTLQRYMRRADEASRNWIGQLFVAVRMLVGALFGLAVGGTSAYGAGRSAGSGARIGLALGAVVGIFTGIVTVAVAWYRRVRTVRGPRG